MKKYYFAYGSNLDINRLESRIGKVKVIGVVNLYGFRLVFNAGAGNQAFANIVHTGDYGTISKEPVKSNVVTGVVYEITSRQLRQLDGFEGAPYLYTRMITTFEGKDLQVYISINPSYTQQEIKGIFPSREYLTYIINGAGRHKIIDTYNRAINLLPFARKTVVNLE